MAERAKEEGVLLSSAAIEAHLAACEGDPAATCAAVGDLYSRIGRRFTVGMAEALVRGIESSIAGGDDAIRSEVASWAEREADAGAPTPVWVRARLLGHRADAAPVWDVALAAAPGIVPEGLAHRVRVRLIVGDPTGAARDLRLALAQPTGYELWSRAERIARKLATGSEVPYARSLRLGLLGGAASLSLLAPLLRLACFRDGIALEFYEADYDAWQQEIIDSQSGLHGFRPDVTLLMTHWRDAELPEYSADPDTVVDAAAQRIAALWQTLSESTGGIVLAQTFDWLADDPYGRLGTALPGGRGAMLRKLNDRLRARAGDGIVLLDLERVAAEVGPSGWSDPWIWHSARRHPAPAALVPLVECQVAHLRAILGLTRKVFVLELDNALWGGVIGEDGLDGIELGPPAAAGEAFQTFHHHLRSLRERGVLLAVCSENNPDYAREPFERHPETVLTLDDFVVFVANWDDKVSNQRVIAEQLSLGLDSFVFVDDDPVERAWVREQLPEVAVPELPEDPSGSVATLTRGRYFEVLSLFDEDRERHESYRAEVERRSLQASAGTMDEFLERLGMRSRHGAFDAPNPARITHLVNETNQLNAVTRRYNEAQLRDQADCPDRWTHWFRLEDRFKDAGLIGVMTCRPRAGEPTAWEIGN